MDYVKKLKSRLAFAYDLASKEVRKNADRHKVMYDMRVRHAALEPGDRVLVRKTGERGKRYTPKTEVGKNQTNNQVLIP